MNKVDLREQLRAKIAAMPLNKKQEASKAICEQLMSIASVLHADSIFAFLPLEDEVDLRPILELWIDASRTVSIPLVNWEEKTMLGGLLTSLDTSTLVETRYGIMEPKERHPLPPESIDVVLVPGIGFDRGGGRLGRGGGFYDRFLATVRPPIVLGVCFEEQIVEAVPRVKHDQYMSAVVTPTNVLVG